MRKNSIISKHQLNYKNQQKMRKGMSRLWHATGFSIEGLCAGWREPAFRLEAYAAFFFLPFSFYIGNNWLEISILSGSVIILMVVELLNTALESIVDRVGLQWHELSKRAKDLGSAAVFLMTILTISIWGGAFWNFMKA
jgi:diacylglycerol kinase (ATP)